MSSFKSDLMPHKEKSPVLGRTCRKMLNGIYSRPLHTIYKGMSSHECHSARMRGNDHLVLSMFHHSQKKDTETLRTVKILKQVGIFADPLAQYTRSLSAP